MTQIYDDPTQFKTDAIAGLAAAYPRYVQPVPGAAGFLRTGGPREGKVSLVVGGGSGHYPSYGGIVGAGLADACVLGDVFTSPSAEQVHRIARAADGGAGIVLAFGNYAGDRLNFGAAADRLRSEGIDVRVVFVTDDIASAPSAEATTRRGIAGTAVVYKIGGAVADLGGRVHEVEDAMRRANAATVTYGVAFGGCTLPGADRPLFDVAHRSIDFGLGIHGEPGIRTTDWMPAENLAHELLTTLLSEPVTQTGRAAIVLNGLGATKYEELFVLYRHVARRLTQLDVEVVLPEVGELVTSLDMAGASLTVTWLDDDLARWWSAPVDTAAFRRGDTGTFPSFPPHVAAAEKSASRQRGSATASEPSRAAAVTALNLLIAATAAIEAEAAELGRLDSVAGDGDHGTGMLRGFIAATTAARRLHRPGIGTLLGEAGDAFADRAGGTSGILWGILLGGVGGYLGDDEAPKTVDVVDAIAEAARRLRDVGGAVPGDKTMVDALVPFTDELRARCRAGADLAAAWDSAARAASEAAYATAPMTPRLGRARPLAARSVGTPDPGAVSFAIVVTTMGLRLRTTSEQPTMSSPRGDVR